VTASIGHVPQLRLSKKIISPVLGLAIVLMDCETEGKEAVQEKITELPLPRSAFRTHLKVAITLNEVMS